MLECIFRFKIYYKIYILKCIIKLYNLKCINTFSDYTFLILFSNPETYILYIIEKVIFKNKFVILPLGSKFKSMVVQNAMPQMDS